jgi:hypothetical protein
LAPVVVKFKNLEKGWYIGSINRNKTTCKLQTRLDCVYTSDRRYADKDQKYTWNDNKYLGHNFCYYLFTYSLNLFLLRHFPVCHSDHESDTFAV